MIDAVVQCISVLQRSIICLNLTIKWTVNTLMSIAELRGIEVVRKLDRLKVGLGEQNIFSSFEVSV